MDDGRTGETLVGRARELARIEELWADGHRLLTLFGPGGIGKTRLALELARGDEGGDSVVFCQLTGADSLASLTARVAHALGLEHSVSPDAPDVDAIGRRLAHGAAILVLDQLEHLVDHAAATVRPWLELAPEVRILVTSRRALGLSEETLFEVGPLADDDGARLFVQRVRRKAPHWTPGDDDARAISALVRRLDGIPLAIKLCAARAAVVSPRELLSLLDARVDVLAAGPDDPVTEHRSLRAALDGSWHMLAPEQQTALARLSVFPGGFTLEAAASVLDGPASALDVIQALRHCSLLRRTVSRKHARSRYAMYEAIRTYAAARLDQQGTRPWCEQRMATYYYSLCERLARDGDIGDELRDDWANLSLAAEQLLRRDPVSAARLLIYLHDPLTARENRSRHARLLRRAADGVRPAHDPPLLARTLTRLAELERGRGRLAEAAGAADEAVQLATEAADDRVLADALRARGELARLCGRLDEAADALTASRAAALRSGDRRAEADARMALLNLHFVQRDMDRVATEGKAAYLIWVELDDLANQALALSAHGLALLETGQYADAERVLEESLGAYRRAGHLPGQGRILVALAELAWQQQRHGAARDLAIRAADLLEPLGAQPWSEMALAVLGLIELSRGRADDALGYVTQADRAVARSGYVRIRVFVHACRGIVEAAVGSMSRAGAALATARDLAAQLEPVLGQFVDACDGILDARAAAAARASNRPDRAERHLSRARARLAELESSGGTSGSLDLRMVEGLLRQALSHAETAPLSHAAATPNPEPDRVDLSVSADGRWFSTSDGGRVSIRRRAWSRILAALATHRIEQPGRGLSTDELFGCGWPGERAVQHAARNRVWVALSALRRQGLDALLVRRAGRYLLDPRAAIRIEQK